MYYFTLQSRGSDGSAQRTVGGAKKAHAVLDPLSMHIEKK